MRARSTVTAVGEGGEGMSYADGSDRGPLSKRVILMVVGKSG